MVDKKNMGIRSPSKKLNDKKPGPFPIAKVVGKWILRVQLREGSQGHPAFYVQLLEPYQGSREETHKNRPPTPEPINRKVIYVVQEIVESRKNNQKKSKPMEYLVLWEGYPNDEGTWEIYYKLKETAEETL